MFQKKPPACGRRLWHSGRGVSGGAALRQLALASGRRAVFEVSLTLGSTKARTLLEKSRFMRLRVRLQRRINRLAMVAKYRLIQLRLFVGSRLRRQRPGVRHHLPMHYHIGLQHLQIV